MSLPTRKIGKDDVTAIGFGLMGLSAFYGAIESDEERFKVRRESVGLDDELTAILFSRPRSSMPPLRKGVHSGIPLMYTVTPRICWENGTFTSFSSLRHRCSLLPVCEGSRRRGRRTRYFLQPNLVPQNQELTARRNMCGRPLRRR